MPDAHSNFAYSNIVTPPSPADVGTSLTVGSGEGSRFPAVPFNATVWAANQIPLSSNAEIVRVTNVSGDVLTITRAQESTSARSIVTGDQIAATVTKKTLTDIETDLVNHNHDAVYAALGHNHDHGALTGLADDDHAQYALLSGRSGHATFSTSVIVGWDNGAGTPDVLLQRDAANVLALRNGTSPQDFRAYNTFTDASNYERGFMRWLSNAFLVGTESAGSGGARHFNISVFGSQTWSFRTNGHLLTLNNNGYDIGADGSSSPRSIYAGTSVVTRGFFEGVEMADPAAPAANKGRLYVRDNGSGKTQLVVRFPTGAIQVIATEP